MSSSSIRNRSINDYRKALYMEARKEELKGVIRFLVADGAGTREIPCRMSAVHDEHCMALSSVQEWHKKFREGCTSPQDDPWPVQAHRAITSDVTAQMVGLIRENRRITEGKIRVQDRAHFHIFVPSKKDIHKRRFHSGEEVQEWVR